MNNWKTGVPPIERNKSDGTRLISEWYSVLCENNTIKAYYHIWYSWMLESEIEEEWKFGYKPLNKQIEGWK